MFFLFRGLKNKRSDGNVLQPHLYSSFMLHYRWTIYLGRSPLHARRRRAAFSKRQKRREWASITTQFNFYRSLLLYQDSSLCLFIYSFFLSASFAFSAFFQGRQTSWRRRLCLFVNLNDVFEVKKSILLTGKIVLNSDLSW